MYLTMLLFTNIKYGETFVSIKSRLTYNIENMNYVTVFEFFDAYRQCLGYVGKICHNEGFFQINLPINTKIYKPTRKQTYSKTCQKKSPLVAFIIHPHLHINIDEEYYYIFMSNKFMYSNLKYDETYVLQFIKYIILDMDVP